MNAQERKELEDAYVMAVSLEHRLNDEEKYVDAVDDAIEIAIRFKRLARYVLYGEYVKCPSKEELASIIHKSIYDKEMDENKPTRNLEIYAIAAAIVAWMKGEGK